MVLGRHLAGGAGRRSRGSARGAIVLAGASGQALAFGPGQVERTPEAGEPGTAIYSAHRDTHFAFLGEVVLGDEIRVTRRDGREVRFRVTGTAVVRWDASGIDPLAGRPQAGAGHLLAARCDTGRARCATLSTRTWWT